MLNSMYKIIMIIQSTKIKLFIIFFISTNKTYEKTVVSFHQCKLTLVQLNLFILF